MVIVQKHTGKKLEVWLSSLKSRIALDQEEQESFQKVGVMLSVD